MRRFGAIEKMDDDDHPMDDAENSRDHLLDLVPPEILFLLPGFLERRQQEVSELSHLLEQNNFAAISAIGHKLKGTGLGFGFPLVSKIGQGLEVGAKGKNVEALRLLISQLANFSEGLRALMAVDAK